MYRNQILHPLLASMLVLVGAVGCSGDEESSQQVGNIEASSAPASKEFPRDCAKLFPDDVELGANDLYVSVYVDDRIEGAMVIVRNLTLEGFNQEFKRGGDKPEALGKPYAVADVRPDDDGHDVVNLVIGKYLGGSRSDEMSVKTGDRIRIDREYREPDLIWSDILEFDYPEVASSKKKKTLNSKRHNLRCAAGEPAWSSEHGENPDFDAEARAAFFEKHGK